VVVLNWNAAADTLACIVRVLAWQIVRPRVIVVDNASTDDDRATLRGGLDASVTLIANDTNLGFAGGTNRGLEIALAQGDAPILLLNNDAVVNDQAVARLAATLDEQPDLGVVGPILYDDHTPPRLHSAGHRDPVRHIHSSITELPAGDPVNTVAYISGSVALIRATTLRRIGLLDEGYFFSTEVADLCRRAAQAGYRTAVDARAAAVHNLARSSPRRSTLYTYYIVRNRLRYVGKFAGRAGRLWWGAWSLYTLALALKLRLQGQPGPAMAVWLALADARSGRWGGQNERVLAACRPYLTP
jgi:GT2 family glycosyltransferase